jgi:hypothetical protein
MPIVLIVSSLIAAHVALAGYLSQRVWRSDFYDGRQKAVQYALLWLLPIVGTVLVWMFLRSERPTATSADYVPADGMSSDIPSNRGAGPRDSGHMDAD